MYTARQHIEIDWLFPRGEAPYDNETVIYVERQESWMDGGSILSSSDLFRTNPKILLYGGKNFKMEGPYMFATKTAVGFSFFTTNFVFVFVMYRDNLDKSIKIYELMLILFCTKW